MIAKQTKRSSMNKIRKVELVIVIVVFVCFLAIWLNSRNADKFYDMDWWYYAGNHGVWPGANFGPPNGVNPGSLGEGHDLALIISRLLVQIGNFALPAFFISFFIGSGYFMLKKLVRFPEAIFVVAPFSLVLLIMGGTYFLFAQMLAMGFFFLAIGFYLRNPTTRDKKRWTYKYWTYNDLGMSICLILMSASHSWSAFFYLCVFGIYLIAKDRWSLIYLVPAILLLASTAPTGFLDFLTVRTSVGQNLSYLVNVQLTENYILLPFLFYGAWRLVKSRIGLLFVVMVAAPLLTILFLWSPYWSYRVVTLIPINVFEAAGVSGLLEYIARRGGV